MTAGFLPEAWYDSEVSLGGFRFLLDPLYLEL